MQRFGSGIRGEWLLRPDAAFLNHGSFGACPRRVLEYQRALQDALERQPVAFMLGVEARLREALRPVGTLLGAHADDLVFVANATDGVNAVVRSLELEAGDRIVTTSWAYGAVANTLRYVARRVGATVEVAHLPFPVGPEGVDWGEVEAKLDGARLLVIDHIASKTAVVLPVEAIVAAARARGVPVLIDGAHAPGQIPLDLDGLGADWWVGNLHKWSFAPKGCAVLHVRVDRREGLHPTAISHGLDRGLHAEFDWTGTRDPTAWLSAPAAVAFVNDLGIDAMWAYQHHIRERGLALLTEAWGVERTAPASCLAAMATVPLPFEAEATEVVGNALRAQLWERHRVEAPFVPLDGRMWLRFSAQVYTDLSEVERLAAAIGPDGVR
ncbi:MAG: isopenicillin-N epimerase [Myxococcota bacterium]|jgi:isopenicillin-N epimerase